MELHCIVTDSHKVLLNEYFKPSLPDNFNLKVAFKDIDQSSDGGRYLSRSFTECLNYKVSYIVGLLEKQDDSIFIVSDVDILFSKNSNLIKQNILDLFDKTGCYMAFQGGYTTNKKHKNFGFFAIRNNEKSKRFWNRVFCEFKTDPYLNEQAIGNRLIAHELLYLKGVESLDLKKYVNNTLLATNLRDENFDSKIKSLDKKSTFMYHANDTHTVQEKIQALEVFKKYFT